MRSLPHGFDTPHPNQLKDKDHGAAMASITDHELKEFHSMERSLFARLVIQMGMNRDLAQQIMALWLWLESVGHPNVVRIISSHSNTVVQQIAREAEQCLDCLNPGSVPSGVTNDIPVTAGLLRKAICRQHFHENRTVATQGIFTILNNVCRRIFHDIGNEYSVQRRRRGMPFGGVISVQGGGGGGPPVAASGVAGVSFPLVGSGPVFGSHPAVHPGPRPFQGIGTNEAGPSERRSPARFGLNPLAPPWNPRQALQAPPWNPRQNYIDPWEERTMFLTFSRGYPLEEHEIRDYFTRRFGDVVRAVLLQRPMGHMRHPPLYARIILNSPAVIPAILNGQEKAKLIIRGRDVWARVYVPRRF